MARLKKKKNSPFCQKINFFPGWLAENEEKYLEKMAKKGWSLKGIHKSSVYYFERCAPENKVYAVEYLGKRPDVAEDIAADCNRGWDYIGTFGKKRYFCADASKPCPAHPSADSEFEQSRLSTTITNLTTLLLLNIPGTLYCMLYCALLLLSDGLSLIPQFSYQFIYIFGFFLGAVSIYVFFRWILAVRKRLKKLSVGGAV